MASHIQTSSCSFWLHHSEEGAKLKRVMLSMVITLSTITLLGGVLAVLSQQGFHLGGGINAISQRIGPIPAYLILSGGAMGLIATTILLAKHLYSSQKKLFSAAELEKMGVLPAIRLKKIPEKIKTKEYKLVTLEPNIEKDIPPPGIYILIVKEANGEVSEFGYRDETDRTAHIHYQLSGFINADTEHEVSKEFAEQYSTDLPVPHPGEYAFRKIKVQGQESFCVLKVHTGGRIHTHFPKKTTDVHTILYGYPDALSYELIQKALHDNCPDDLGVNSYCEKDVTIGGTPLYLLYYGSDQTYFRSQQDREDFLETLGFPQKELFLDLPIADIVIVIEEGQFQTEDVIESESTIYLLHFRRKGDMQEIKSFETDAERKAFISEQLQDLEQVS